MKLVLVCGGRDYQDRDRVALILDAIHQEHPDMVVLHGAARGADALAGAWAGSRGVRTQAMPADWATHGKAAGPIRNQAMLDLKPNVVVAFPGGHGTAHMVAIARRAGVEVVEVA